MWIVPPIFSSNSVSPVTRSTPQFVPIANSPRRFAPGSISIWLSRKSSPFSALALAVLGGLRELLGTGKLTIFAQAKLDATIIPLAEGQEFLFKFMVDPPGAFVCLGAMLMLMNVITARSTKAA